MSASPSPTTYGVSLFRDGFAVVEVYANGFGRNVLEREFDCEFGAWARIDELLAAEAEEAAALAQFDIDNAAIDAERAAAAEAYEDEIQTIWNLVNAQGGYVAPSDKLGQARGRAIDAVLAAIDALAQKAA